MTSKRNVIRLPYEALADASGTGVIRSDKVQSSQMLVSQSIAFRNRTGARGTITLCIRNIGTLFELGDQEFPDQDTWYFYPYEQHLIEGEQIEIRQASCTQNDVLQLRILGYIEYIDNRGN